MRTSMICDPRQMAQSFIEKFVLERTGEHVRLDRIPDRVILALARAIATDAPEYGKADRDW